MTRCCICREMVSEVDEWAECKDCAKKEYDKLYNLWKDPNSFVVKKVVTIDPTIVQNIREFFCENYGKLFKRKKEALSLINRRFNTQLKLEKLESMTHTTTLRRLGMKYKHREFLIKNRDNEK